MPTYEYVCKSCGEHLEIVQSFTDAPLAVCPACGGELRKVFGNVGIVFKGSGFYRNDSRSGTRPSSKPADVGADKDKATGKAAESKSDSGEPARSTAGDSKESTVSKSTESKSKPADSQPAATAAS